MRRRIASRLLRHRNKSIEDEHDAGYDQCSLPRVANDHLYQEKAKGNEKANDNNSRRDVERDFEDEGHIKAPGSITQKARRLWSFPGLRRLLGDRSPAGLRHFVISLRTSIHNRKIAVCDGGHGAGVEAWQILQRLAEQCAERERFRRNFRLANHPRTGVICDHKGICRRPPFAGWSCRRWVSTAFARILSIAVTAQTPGRPSPLEG